MNLIPPQPEVGVEVGGDRRFVIYGVSWESYEKILEAMEDRPIFLTYDEGNLEFMSPSSIHERCKVLLALFVKILCEELDIPILQLGQTTWKRKDLKRALEADDCFYIQNVRRVLPTMGKRNLDLNRDPPPDLAIEIDISRSAIDRQSVYAAIGVQEIWRYNGKSLRVDCLGPDGEYELLERSPTFPYLDLSEVLALIEEDPTRDDTTMSRLCRAWIRKHVVPLAKKGKPASGKKRKRNP